MNDTSDGNEILQVYLFVSHPPKKIKKQEKPTNANANHMKETQVRATRIICRCEVWSVKCGVSSVESGV